MEGVSGGAPRGRAVLRVPPGWSVERGEGAGAVVVVRAPGGAVCGGAAGAGQLSGRLTLRALGAAGSGAGAGLRARAESEEGAPGDGCGSAGAGSSSMSAGGGPPRTFEPPPLAAALGAAEGGVMTLPPLRVPDTSNPGSPLVSLEGAFRPPASPVPDFKTFSSDRTPQRATRGARTHLLPGAGSTPGTPSTPHSGRLEEFFLNEGSSPREGAASEPSPARGARTMPPSGFPSASPGASEYRRVLSEIEAIKGRLDALTELGQFLSGGAPRAGGQASSLPCSSPRIPVEALPEARQGSGSPITPDRAVSVSPETGSEEEDACNWSDEHMSVSESAVRDLEAEVEPTVDDAEELPAVGRLPALEASSEEFPAGGELCGPRDSPDVADTEGLPSPAESPSWSSSSSSGFARAVATWDAERSVDLGAEETSGPESTAEPSAELNLETSGLPSIEQATTASQTDFEYQTSQKRDAGSNTEPGPGFASQASQAALLQEERLPTGDRTGRTPGVRKVFAWQARLLSHDGAAATLFRETVVRVCDAATEPAPASAPTSSACQTEAPPVAPLAHPDFHPPSPLGPLSPEEEASGQELSCNGWTEVTEASRDEEVLAVDHETGNSHGTEDTQETLDRREGEEVPEEAEEGATAALTVLRAVRPPRPRLWVPERDGYFNDDDDDCPPRAVLPLTEPQSHEAPTIVTQAQGEGPGPADLALDEPADVAATALSWGQTSLGDALKDPDGLKLEVLWLLEALDRRRCHLHETLELTSGA